MIRINDKKIESLFDDILRNSRFSSVEEYLRERLKVDVIASKKSRLNL